MYASAHLLRVPTLAGDEAVVDDASGGTRTGGHRIGTTDGLYVYGTAINFCFMMTVNYKAALWTGNWTAAGAIFLFLSITVRTVPAVCHAP